MKRTTLAVSLACISALVILLPAGQPPQTGPATEKRFPPLKAPPGFKATLFACDPLIEYPSVIAAGPRPGAIFVAVDFMTGLGSDGKVKSEVRLVEDADGDGYADKATTIARGFNSIQGLAYHDNTLFVMHAPYLTSLTLPSPPAPLAEGEGRKTLLTGLGLQPEDNASRLHCANGVVVGHDGWLYLALGDNGVNVPRPEGDRLIHNGGAILRCRLDGRGLHVFSTGLRNIYDIALDAELNVFTRDNENDGGTYMNRVCHSFFGADHGYPYDYYERPEHAHKPIGDFGLGSSAGGACYLEMQFPKEYRGNLFFCEWGRSVVRYPLTRNGAGFAPVNEIEFLAGDPKDTYPFKPTDVVVQRDGTLMISDYADGQRPKRGRGRIYHVAFDGHKQQAKSAATLDSESYFARCDAQAAIERAGKMPTMSKLSARGRMHAVWALSKIDGPNAIDALFEIAATDADSGVRVQAIRAIADLADPLLVKYKRDVHRDAARLAELDAKGDKQVLLEIAIALGRFRWSGAPDWLRTKFVSGDDALAHAAMQALRRCNNWPGVLALLEQSGPTRTIALRALADQYDPVIVDGIVGRLAKEKSSAQRAGYAEPLARAYKKPGPWKYWGYRPGLRPANSVTWERTEAIEKTLNFMLADESSVVCLAALKQMQREKVPISVKWLVARLQNEMSSEHEAVLIPAIAEHAGSKAREPLYAVVISGRRHSASRLLALDLLLKDAEADTHKVLLKAASDLVSENTSVSAEVVRRLARHPKGAPVNVFAKRLHSPNAEVRAAAIEGLGAVRALDMGTEIREALQDEDIQVLRAAAAAAGKLNVRDANELVLELAHKPDLELRRACLDTLRRLQERRARALALKALNEPILQLTALEYLEELGDSGMVKEVVEFAKRHPTSDGTQAALRVLSTWRGHLVSEGSRRAVETAIAEIHGANGMLVTWYTDRSQMPPLLLTFGAESRLMVPPNHLQKSLWCEIHVPNPTPIEFLASSRGSLEVALNGKREFQRKQPAKFQLDADRFPATLKAGMNQIRVDTGLGGGIAEFHLRFRRRSSKAEHEKLAQAALNRPGNPERGKRLFFDREKSQCIKCHQISGEGERIGPELTGVGSRFSRIHLIESILEPSRTIAPSFGTYVIELKSGKTLSGVKLGEDETTLSLADNQGTKHKLAKKDIESSALSALSTMPDGLEQRLTQDEFVDLIAFLVSQKEQRRP